MASIHERQLEQIERNKKYNLAPCPFCGGSAWINCTPLEHHTREDEWVLMNEVGCFEQKCDVYSGSVDEDADVAVENWNRRAVTQPSARETGDHLSGLSRMMSEMSATNLTLFMGGKDGEHKGALVMTHDPKAIRALDRMMRYFDAQDEEYQPEYDSQTLEGKIESAAETLSMVLFDDLSLPLESYSRDALIAAWREALAKLHSIGADLDEAVELLADQNSAPVAGLPRPRWAARLDAELTGIYGELGFLTRTDSPGAETGSYVTQWDHELTRELHGGDLIEEIRDYAERRKLELVAEDLRGEVIV